MTTTNPEHQPPERDPPAAYFASLSDYNAGHLHGEWINANQTPEEIETEIRSMLRQSRDPRAEEWAIHDHSGFEPWKPAEHETIQALSRVALGIEAHGEAFTHWIASQSQTDQDTVDRFEDVYLGKWPSLTAYAEDLVADLGDEPETFTPSWLQPYVSIDYQALGRDIAHDLYISEDNHDIHLFRAD